MMFELGVATSNRLLYKLEHKVTKTAITIKFPVDVACYVQISRSSVKGGFS